MKMRLVFKGGAVVDVDTDEFTVTRDPLGSGGLTRLGWTTPREFEVKLSWVNLGELAAVVHVVETGDGEDVEDTKPEAAA